jgi:hypothetical protein
LRVLKAVLEIKGAKRFKRENNNNGDSMNHDDIIASFASGQKIDMSKSKEIFRSMNNRTSYNTQFGDRPKGSEDYLACKYKLFRTLDISNYIQPQAAAFIEKWLTINDQEEFTKRIFFTIRDMHTIVRN